MDNTDFVRRVEALEKANKYLRLTIPMLVIVAACLLTALVPQGQSAIQGKGNYIFLVSTVEVGAGVSTAIVFRCDPTTGGVESAEGSYAAWRSWPSQKER